jgi:hypothetical protein
MRERLKRGEQGQIVALLAVSLVCLLAISALVMDVGYAWYAKRQMQSQVDAAALAAAQELPNQTSGNTLITSYLAKNAAPSGVTQSSQNVSYSWLQNSRSGAPVNKVTVEESGQIPSVFGKFVGIDAFDYDVKGTACQPCGSKKFDIVLVVDRSASMCDSGPGCYDLDNAKAGMRELFQTMDAKLDSIGLVAFPPVVNSANVCNSPGGYDDPRTTYLTDPLRQDYQLADGTPALTSSLYLHTVAGNGSCIPDGGGTSYVDALRTGVAQLAHHRSGAQPVLIFMTDGSANTGPVFKCSQSYPSVAGCVDRRYDDPDDIQPCHSAVQVAQAAKDAGVIVYAIGYGLYTSGKESFCWRGVWQRGDGSFQLTPTDTSNWKSGHAQGVNCYDAHPQQLECLESPGITPQQALQAIATPGAGKYFDSAAGDVRPVFQAIASDIENGTSHLVDDGS